MKIAFRMAPEVDVIGRRLIEQSYGSDRSVRLSIPLAKVRRDVMSPEEFRGEAELNTTVSNYLDRVAQKADPKVIRDRSVALTLLFGVAAYALYRKAKNHFDHQRGLDEAELRQIMLDQADALVQKGWAPDKALEAIETVSKDVAGLRPDSPVLKAALAVLGNGQGPG